MVMELRESPAFAARPGRDGSCRRGAAGSVAGLVLGAAALLAALAAGPARASTGPYIWDQDGNGVDDRIESVNLLGYSASFELSDTTLHQRIEVTRGAGGLVYGVYVLWDHTPTQADLLALTALGMPVLTRIEAIPATRSLATFAQVESAAALPGVERVEAVPLLYGGVRDGCASIGVRDETARVFPSWALAGGASGHGVVVAILDTGVNDEAEGAYPGHESLRGRCLGGAQFVGADSVSQTPKTGSVNPADNGGQATHAHGTHVAGIVLGTGGRDGYAVGVAPAAEFVDVKVLSDAGSGVSLPEALDWCIANRDRDWGSPDPAERGIQVINLSLSSPDLSDGQDLASRLAAKAVELGIVVVASMGNDGLSGHVPSPAAGDGVIAVGAWDDARSGDAADDTWPAFNNTGPRASDQDADPLDELKPDLLAPGVDVLSANGDPTTDGTRYQRLSGTSMAAAFVSGAAALLVSQDPALTPGQVAELLRATARRNLAGVPAATTGPDPRWNSARGCGELDAYAAWLELTQPQRSQVRRLVLDASPLAVNATLWTQRERGAAYFAFERAPDVNGAPGAFAAFDSVAAAGDSSLADGTNLTLYARAWPVPLPEAGQAFWYRVAYSEQGVRWATPARRFTSPGAPSVATLDVTIVHNAYDSDVEAVIAAPASGVSFPLPGTSGAIASDYVDGESVTGNESWSFRIEVPPGAADASLPPDDAHPWTLSVTDAGEIDRTGRVTDYRLTWHAAGGDQVFTGSPLPCPTLQGGTVSARIPPSSLAVGGGAGAAFTAGPNPARAGAAVSFRLARPAAPEVTVFDLAGRRVARVPLAAAGGTWAGTWSGRDDAGRALPAGIYLARNGPQHVLRIALLTR